MANLTLQTADVLYNINVLKTIRESIKKALKKSDLNLGDHYNLSPCTTERCEFKLSTVVQTRKSKLNTTLSRLSKRISTEFNGSILIHDSGKELTLNVKNLYSKISSEKGENGEGIPAVGLKTGDLRSNAGRKITEFGEFRKNLVDFIELNTKAEEGKKTTGFRVEIPTGGTSKNRQVLLHCAGDLVLNDIVCALEKTEFYSPRISVKKNTVYVWHNPPEQTEKHGELEVVQTFFKKLQAESKEKGFEFSVSTPMIIAAVSDPVQVNLQFIGAGQAASFCAHVDKTWDPKKEGVTVSISIPKIKIKKLLVDESELMTSTSVKHGLSIQPVEGEKGGTYVHMSKDYKDFHFLPFNRKRKKKHVMELVESMQNFGVQSFVNVALTDCIDGKLKKWVIDGQHRFDALEYLKSPILYTVANVHSKKEMVRLIAVLNHTAKTWSLKDYLHAWQALNMSDYILLDRHLHNSKLPITVLLEIFTELPRNQASDKFQNGKFEIKDIKKSEKYINFLVDFRGILPRSREILSSLVVFFEKLGEEYENEKMREQLIRFKKDNNQKLPFEPGQTQEEIVATLRTLYNAA